MTLAQWSVSWPYVVRRFQPTDAQTGQPSGPVTDAYVTPDANHGHRTAAFGLDDYRVSSIAGGSIWFTPKV